MTVLGGTPLADCEDVAWFRDQAEGARGSAAALTRRIGFSEHRSAEVVLAVAELVTNMRKHAVDGALILRVLRTPAVAGAEVVVLDHGPGMADVPAAVRDGMSTAGTLGIGLGAVRRLADTYDVHSRPGLGTIQMARFWPRPVGAALMAEPLVGGITRPIGGEQVCGDAWAARTDSGDRTHHTQEPAADTVPSPRRPALDWRALTGTDGGASRWADRTAADEPRGRRGLVRSVIPGAGDGMLVMSCDGLGHGPAAALAGRAAVQAFATGAARTPEQAMQEVHRALHGTRGAAVAIARIEPAERRLLFCGVGNITAAVVTGTTRTNLLSHPGIVGHQMRQLRTYEHTLPALGALVLHSDGLSERWTAADVAGFLHHAPAVVAAGLLRHAGTRRDDASVVIAKGAW
ncbi:ATP-binding protein [Streptomyces sp. NPDC058653]|uniref:ATP-binding protein n=1 Tax=Streptomyces sp. NPDC058653 TaxID=3346576 RepID=UPI00364B852E